MATLHWRIMILLAWLAFFFNIGRVDIVSDGGLNLTAGTYVVGLLATLLPLVPLRLKQSLLALAALISALYMITLVFSSTPVVDGVHIYLTLTGAFMVLTTLVLSYQVGQALEEFREAVEMLTFSDKGGRLRNLSDVQETLDIEMTRSRRAGRSLSVMLFQADTSSLNMTMHRLVQEVQRSMMQRYVLAITAKMISQYLRRTDVVFEDPKPGRLVLLAPETGEEEATKVGERIALLVGERLGINVSFSTAAFPQQAITFEDLLNVAEQRLQSAPVVKEEVLKLDSEILELKEAPVEYTT